MTWKNPSKNKSKKLPLTQLRNLPFEQEDSVDNHEDSTPVSSSQKEGIGGDGDVQMDTAVISDESIDHMKQSHMYEEQGNKLAEVILLYIYIFFMQNFFFWGFVIIMFFKDVNI